MKKILRRLLDALKKWRHWDDLVIGIGLASVAIGTYGFLQSKVVVDGGERSLGFLEAFYRSLILFTCNTGPQDGSIPLSLEIGRWGALIAVYYAAFKGIFLLLHRLGWRLKISNHVIIWGYNEIGKALASEYLRRGDKVMIIDRDPQLKEKAELNWNLFPVVCDDTNSIRQTLIESSIKTARFIFAVTEDDDFNIKVAENCFSMRESFKKRSCLQGFVHLNNQNLKTLCWHHPNYSTNKGNLSFKFFNMFDLAARAVLNQVSPDRRFSLLAGKNADHVLLIGCGAVGKSILIQLLKTWHFDNAQKLEVSIIDKKAALIVEKLRIDFPGIESLFNLHAFELDINLLSAEELNQKIVGSNPVSTAFICLDQPNLIIETAFRLRRWYFNYPVQLVLVFRSEKSVVAKLLGRLERKETDARIFAYSTTGFEHTIDYVVCETLDQVLKLAYDKMHKTDSSQNWSAWDKLSEEMKESNRLVHDHQIIKIRALNRRRWLNGGKRYVYGEKLSDEEIEMLAEMEHRRWFAERTLAGWRWSETKDLIRKTNPLLIPWARMTKSDQENDKRFAAESLPNLQNNTGSTMEKGSLCRKIKVQELKLLLKHQSMLGEEYLKAPIIAYQMSAEQSTGPSSIPEPILRHLGKIDSVTYSEKYFKKQAPSVAGLQMLNQSMPDFYLIPGNHVAENYSAKKLDLSCKIASGLFDRLPEEVKRIFSSQPEKFIMLQKLEPVNLIALSSIGYCINEEIELVSPEGYSQKKPAGKEGFIVADSNSIYLINANERGFPINYLLT